MRLSLMVTEGVHAGQVIAVNGVSLWIGRGPQCHVRPNSPAVAERHCYLTVRGERAFLRDLDSRSGTFMNDRQLRGEIELRDGDHLRVGPLVFVVLMEDLAEPARSEPLLPAPRTAAETQEMPAYVPEPSPNGDETQEIPASDQEPLPAPSLEEPSLAVSASGLSPQNGSHSKSTWATRSRARRHT